MSTVELTQAPPEVHYPEADGKPMAETEIHLKNAIGTLDNLWTRYEDDEDVYVGGNMFIYFVEGEPKKCVAPDVFFVRGVKKGLRRVYKTWEEGANPDAIFEYTSRKTKNEDERKKLPIYRDELRVYEYFRFDPEGDYLNPRLQGLRLIDGEYVRIEPVDGRIPSEVLGLHLEADGLILRLYDPETKKRLPFSREAAQEAAQNAAREKQRAAREKEKAAREKEKAARAQEAFQREKEIAAQAQTERDASRSALENAEAELEQLRQEVERLRSAAGGRPSDEDVGGDSG